MGRETVHNGDGLMIKRTAKVVIVGVLGIEIRDRAARGFHRRQETNVATANGRGCCQPPFVQVVAIAFALPVLTVVHVVSLVFFKLFSHDLMFNYALVILCYLYEQPGTCDFPGVLFRLFFVVETLTTICNFAEFANSPVFQIFQVMVGDNNKKLKVNNWNNKNNKKDKDH